MTLIFCSLQTPPISTFPSNITQLYSLSYPVQPKLLTGADKGAPGLRAVVVDLWPPNYRNTIQVPRRCRQGGAMVKEQSSLSCGHPHTLYCGHLHTLYDPSTSKVQTGKSHGPGAFVFEAEATYIHYTTQVPRRCGQGGPMVQEQLQLSRGHLCQPLSR
eukprot:scaffold108829_cov18-Tisochrysis_lutea.AAC.1